MVFISNKKIILALSIILLAIFCINMASAANETETLTANQNDHVLESSDDIKKDTTILVDSQLTRQASDVKAGEESATVYATLLDEDNRVLANKSVQVAMNGPIQNLTTDSFGRIPIETTFSTANVYSFAIAFSGDDTHYASQLAPTKLKITKKQTSISASSKTFKSSAKTKTVTATLKTTKNMVNGKTYLSSAKKLTLKVNGKTYTGKTNSKNQVKFKIKLTKKGKFKAKITFAGDSTYSSSSKSIKITIK